jgi:tetratricopeptide (TPR) repeat protein
LLEIAEIYRRLNRPQRALAALGALRETYAPDEVPAQVRALEGAAYTALGRHRDALAAWQAVVDKAPSSDHWIALAVAQHTMGNLTAARESLKHARELDPQHTGLAKIEERITTQDVRMTKQGIDVKTIR